MRISIVLAALTFLTLSSGAAILPGGVSLEEHRDDFNNHFMRVRDILIWIQQQYKTHNYESAEDAYFNGMKQLSRDQEYPVIQDSHFPERIWRQVTLVAHYFRSYTPFFYHTSVQIADSSLYNPEKNYSGAKGYTIGNNEYINQVSGQSQFLKTELNSGPKSHKHKNEIKFPRLKIVPICMTDKTEKEIMQHMLKFPGPYEVTRHNCQEHSEWLLEFACGQEIAETGVALFRNIVFDYIKAGEFPIIDQLSYQPNPDYKWHVEEYIDEDEWQRQKALTLTSDEALELELMNEKDPMDFAPKLPASKRKPKKSWTGFISSGSTK